MIELDQKKNIGKIKNLAKIIIKKKKDQLSLV